MKTNPPYSPNKKLVLHFICKASFCLFFWVFGWTSGQLYVSDATILSVREGAFIAEKTKEEALIVYIEKGTPTSNFPMGSNFVIIESDVNKEIVQPTVFLTENPQEEPPVVEVIQQVHSKVEAAHFVRIDKATDRTLLSLRLNQIHAVVEVNSKNKEKHFDKPLEGALHASFLFSKRTDVETQEFKNKSNNKTTLFVPRGPPFLDLNTQLF